MTCSLLKRCREQAQLSSQAGGHERFQTAKLSAFLLLIAVCGSNGCATRPPTRETQTTFTLGATTIHAKVLQHGHPLPTMVNLHDDENTSVRAGRVVVLESGGRLIELAHSGRRRVDFLLDGMLLNFDPNRIFSDEGIRATLTRGGKYSVQAHEVVARFARQFLERHGLDREPVIVALHNTDGRGLTINTYLSGQQKDRAGAAVHVSARRAAGDFFYVTDARFFGYLKAREFNVVLQDDSRVPDDGSLSVYFARKGIPYINVEANVNHFEEQVEMVRAATEMLKLLGLIAQSR